MKSHKLNSTSLVKVLACTVVALGAICLAKAQTATSVSPVGTWTWVQAGRGGGGGGGGGRGRGGAGGTNTLVLKLDGTGKVVTGTLTSPGRGGRGGRRGGAAPADGSTNAAPAAAPAPPPPVVTDITDGKWDAGTATVSFSISRAGRGGGDPIVTPYTGKVTADKITGTYTFTPPGGDATPVDWVATKQP
jgi:hypothetical protein